MSILRVIIISLCFLLNGCTHLQEELRIPPAPEWVQPQGEQATFTPYEVAQRVSVLAPEVKLAGVSDKEYTLVSYVWLKSFVDWTWKVAPIVGVKYTLNSFDCEDFTRLFNTVVSLKASQAKVFAAPLTADTTVSLKSGSLHALVAVATDKGIYIVEPQPDAGPFRLTKLEDYKDRILAVEFGLASPF